MNLQRMRFAQARGARTQSLMGGQPGCWIGSTGFFAQEGDRVIPRDEHLQYGPLSSALIEGVMTDNPDIADGMADSLALGAFVVIGELTDADFLFATRFTKVERQMFHLFIAEALADLGM